MIIIIDLNIKLKRSKTPQKKFFLQKSTKKEKKREKVSFKRVGHIDYYSHFNKELRQIFLAITYIRNFRHVVQKYT